MNIAALNDKLFRGEVDIDLFPHVARLKQAAFIFKTDFGLSVLPHEPGILLIRGARQYGKSTWLEQEVLNTIAQFGAGSAYYLNGEYLANTHALENAIDELLPLFAKNAPVQRIFIDEITAITDWEMALKKLADQGKLVNTLIVTTGSKATDLRRGAERLPGRKGKLARTNYLFTPIAYAEFHRVCFSVLGEKTLISYLLSGGSPIACNELATQGVLPEYAVTLTRDWIEGEIARSGRSRHALMNIMDVLFRFGGTPVGQAKLSREAALANNTVASGYIELLNDLGCVTPAYPWDQHRKLLILRKPCKYPFINLLAAIAYHPSRLRCVDDFFALPAQEQGMWYEWLVAQELSRRAAIQGEHILEPLAFWQNNQHEIDFVTPMETFIEVKRGLASITEFAWFAQQFPGKLLTIISKNTFETTQINSVTLENFLLAF